MNKKNLKYNPFLNLPIICNYIFFLFIIVLYLNYLYQANKFSNLNNPWLIGDLTFNNLDWLFKKENVLKGTSYKHVLSFINSTYLKIKIKK